MSETTAVGQPETVAPVSYDELGPGEPAGASGDLNMLGDVHMDVTVELGRVKLTVRELLGLRDGSVVELDRVAGAAVDILVNGRLVARGDVIVVDDELGVRVTEITSRR